MCGAVPISDFVYAYVFTVLMYVHTFEILFIEASKHILQTIRNIYSIIYYVLSWNGRLNEQEQKNSNNKNAHDRHRPADPAISFVGRPSFPHTISSFVIFEVYARVLISGCYNE